LSCLSSDAEEPLLDDERGMQMGDSQELIMDYGKVNAAGQAAVDIGTNLAVVLDQTGSGRTAGPRSFPGATSQAVIYLDGVWTEHVNGHIDYIRRTGNGIQASVDVTAAADNSVGGDARSIPISGAI
jgi:hypothetical protein